MREDIGERLRAAAELGRLERVSRTLDRAIVDTTTELKGALAERDAARTRSLEDIRRDAQAAWLVARAQAVVSQPPGRSHESTLDLTGDLAAARREAREQWIAHRQGAQLSVTAPLREEAHGKSPSRIILPDDDHAK
jgi:hypothetical protein